MKGLSKTQFVQKPTKTNPKDTMKTQQWASIVLCVILILEQLGTLILVLVTQCENVSDSFNLVRDYLN